MTTEEKKEHKHKLEPSILKAEIYREGGDNPSYIIVQYWCPTDEDGNDCPDQMMEERVLKVDAP